MRYFETLILFSPELSNEEREGITEHLTAIVVKEGGEIKEVDKWGMKTLMYPVRKQTRGYYTRLEYIAPAHTIAELERIIRITEGIYKFLTIRLEAKEQEIQ